MMVKNEMLLNEVYQALEKEVVDNEKAIEEYKRRIICSQGGIIVSSEKIQEAQKKLEAIDEFNKNI